MVARSAGTSCKGRHGFAIVSGGAQNKTSSPNDVADISVVGRLAVISVVTMSLMAQRVLSRSRCCNCNRLILLPSLKPVWETEVQNVVDFVSCLLTVKKGDRISLRGALIKCEEFVTIESEIKICLLTELHSTHNQPKTLTEKSLSPMQTNQISEEGVAPLRASITCS